MATVTTISMYVAYCTACAKVQCGRSYLYNVILNTLTPELCHHTMHSQTLIQKYSMRGGYLYFTILNDGDGGWLASQDGPLPIVYCTNKQVKGGG